MTETPFRHLPLSCAGILISFKLVSGIQKIQKICKIIKVALDELI